MKHSKIIRDILLVAAVLLMTVALAACKSEPQLEKIEVEGYREDFFVGDIFETGVDFKVYGVYDDGSRKEITEGYNVKQESGFDMYTVDNYMITVEYGGKKAVYTIYVNEADSELKKLTVDTSGMKTTLALGDSVEFPGIRLNAEYVNSSGREISVTYGDLKQFDVSVKDEDGNEIGNVFEKFGKYTVTVSADGVGASFTVEVKDVNLDTIGNVIYAAKYGSQYVNSGTMVKTDTVAASKSSNYSYRFGDNFTYIKTESVSEAYGAGVTENYYSLDEDGKLIAAQFDNGNQSPVTIYVPEAMNGVPVGLWWQAETEYGIEAVITNLYKYAVANANGDYAETIDQAKKTYGFSYSYRMVRTTGVKDDDYFFVNKVEFTLGENYAIASASVTQILYYSGFSVDEDGHTKLDEGASPAYTLEIDVTQTTGERTEKNPYGGDALVIKDFNLYWDGDLLGEDDVIYGKAGESLTLRIGDLDPSDASFASDMLYISDGSSKGEPTIYVGNGFTAYRSDNIIHVKLVGGGDWEMVISTKQVTKRVKFSVTGAAPTELTSEVYKSAFNTFTETNKITPMVGVAVYFRAMPNEYANGAYTAELVDKNADVILEKAQINGVECWKLVASKAGNYQVKMTSTENADVYCILAVTAVEVPDLNAMLNGNYTATDNEDGVYRLTFKQTASAVATSGTVEITYIVNGETKTENMKFTVSDSDLSLILEPESTVLGVAIRVNANGMLVLEDRYGMNYILTAEA